MNTRPTTIRLQEYTRDELGKIADSKGKKVGAYIREVLEVHISEYDENAVHEGDTESILSKEPDLYPVKLQDVPV